MLGRNGGKRKAVADAAESMAEYMADRELRERVLRAAALALAVRERAARQLGRAAVMMRLAGDPVLRRQLAELATQLEKAQQRAQRKRSHTLRNVLLATAGLGAAGVALAPAPRRWVVARIGGCSALESYAGLDSRLKTIVEEIEVAVPVSTAYNQWTQFEEFPKFMDGVEEVRQLDDTLLHWVAKVAGKHAEWDAKIVEQEPDARIAWDSVDGKHTSGSVSFEPAGPTRARIRVQMTYPPEGLLEATGSAAGLDVRQVRGDLERFRELVESTGVESGAWRGEIHGGEDS
jgi:uncharacterized membrane protein